MDRKVRIYTGHPETGNARSSGPCFDFVLLRATFYLNRRFGNA